MCASESSHYGVNLSLIHLQGPSLQMIRRHARSSEQMHYGPALQTVSGNWVAGKRKGVIGGVDFGSTGTVSPSWSLLALHSEVFA